MLCKNNIIQPNVLLGAAVVVGYVLVASLLMQVRAQYMSVVR